MEDKAPKPKKKRKVTMKSKTLREKLEKCKKRMRQAGLRKAKKGKLRKAGWTIPSL